MITPIALALFSGLSEQEKESLLEGGKQRRLARGKMLFIHGEKITHFYILLSGAMQLFRVSPDGTEKTIAILQPGQTMCEDEIMDSCHGHRASAVAIEDSAVLEFPVAWLKDTARAYSAFALNLLSLIADRAHLMEVEAEHQATMSAAQLVACFIQRLCVLHNFNPSGFELPYSKNLIASRLGMEAETFSRTLAKLKDHGIIIEGNRVAITDLARIDAYVCDACSISRECTTHQAMERKMSGNN